MKCSACGAAELIQRARDMPYTYKGEKTVIANVQGDYCPSCDEVILDDLEARRVSAAMLDFNKQINLTSVDPVFVATVRRKLKLDQKEAGDIFGGGVNAFSRYENGKAKPPVALVKLLKLLDKHPELLQEIRAA
ncbi:type II toxin-antitoxin system MqsA family antitoxin [Rhizobium sp. XQZ8]|jgi:HTH-type transcriptional regulator / antitoxin MqsA|uniref:type II TA system antitoxin MqsA family protein n=1 Tax=Rhizobium populisoli TaxID=2859785 RepID=UPI001C663F3D|nr:type II TA system antitoxin MqsA family protein [Rhizobium populisoli]MBW6420419.1 type II toxin-antitoxin system MqsA family antitoxin [Rhizobium populisoli]